MHRPIEIIDDFYTEEELDLIFLIPQQYDIFRGLSTLQT